MDNKAIQEIIDKTNISKQERFLEMYRNFINMPMEDQLYVGGIIQGMYLKNKKNGAK